MAAAEAIIKAMDEATKRYFSPKFDPHCQGGILEPFWSG